VSELRDSLSETEGTIREMKAERRAQRYRPCRQRYRTADVELNKQLAGARAEVTEKKLRLEQARRLYENGGDIQAIPDVMASVPITQLRQQQSELKWREEELSRN